MDGGLVDVTSVVVVSLILFTGEGLVDVTSVVLDS